MKKLMLLAFVLGAAACSHHDGNGKRKLLAVNNVEEVSIRKKTDLPFATVYGSWTGQSAGEKGIGQITYMIREIDPIKKRVTANRGINGSSQVVIGDVIAADASKIDMTFRVWQEHGNTPLTEQLMFQNGVMRVVAVPYKNGTVSPSETILQKKQFRYRPEVTTDSVFYVDFEHPKKVKKEVEAKIQGETKLKRIRPSYPVTTDAVIGINASAVALSESDLKNLKKPDLQFLRNTIYARHGYIFKSESLSDFYCQFIWYEPVSQNVTPQLSLLEQKNLKLIKRFEKYAEDYYEFFGR